MKLICESGTPPSEAKAEVPAEGPSKDTEPKETPEETPADEDSRKRRASEEPEDGPVPKKPSASPDHSDEEPEMAAAIPKGVRLLTEMETVAQAVRKSSPVLEKLSIIDGDITKVQCDAIVNAANAPLRGGGGVDGAIHSAAGFKELQSECRKHLTPIKTGEAVSTGACALSTHVKRIIHAVGPICSNGRVAMTHRRQLLSCYRRSLEICVDEGLRSVAFCCISTGIYGYPNDDAAFNVLRFLTRYLKNPVNADKFDRIILVLFMEVDQRYYTKYIQKFIKNDDYFEELEADAGESDEEKGKGRAGMDGEGSDGEKEEKKEDIKEEQKEEQEHKEREEQREADAEVVDKKEDNEVDTNEDNKSQL